MHQSDHITPGHCWLFAYKSTSWRVFLLTDHKVLVICFKQILSPVLFSYKKIPNSALYYSSILPNHITWALAEQIDHRWSCQTTHAVKLKQKRTKHRQIEGLFVFSPSVTFLFRRSILKERLVIERVRVSVCVCKLTHSWLTTHSRLSHPVVPSCWSWCSYSCRRAPSCSLLPTMNATSCRGDAGRGNRVTAGSHTHTLSRIRAIYI